MRSKLKNKKNLVALASLLLLAACSTDLVDKPKSFFGFSAISISEEGYRLSWPVAEGKGDATYSVYTLKASVLPVTDYSVYEQISESLAGTRTTRFIPSSLLEAFKNQALSVAGSLSDTSYTITGDLIPTSDATVIYVAADFDDGKDKMGAQALLFEAEDFSVGGCVSIEPVATDKLMKVNFNWPSKATQFVITRDGEQIFSTESPLVTSYRDSDVKFGATYNYRCIPVVGGTPLTTPEVAAVLPDPLNEFTGCRVLSSGLNNITLGFDIPSDAEKMTIYRDNKEISVVRNTSKRRFTDVDLSIGAEYEYTCEAEIAGHISAGTDGGVLTTSTKSVTEQLGQRYLGCLDETSAPLGTTQIEIGFAFPTGASKVKIYRNGSFIFESQSSSKLSYVDSGLTEGLTYIYRCVAEIAGLEIEGSNQVSLATISTQAPDFDGIISASAASSSSVSLTWNLADSSGVPTKEYRVYAQAAVSMNWAATATETFDPIVSSATLSNLGEELPYLIGVRACSYNDICDDNTTAISVTIPDSGLPPATEGLESVSINSGELELSVPWEPSAGGLSLRKVYVKTGGAASNAIGDYTLTKIVSVPSGSIHSPLETIPLTGISENTTYHIIVRDVDVAGNESTNTAVQSITSGDLTPPVFSGLSSLSNAGAGQEETSLLVNFTAVANISENASGVSHYQVYTKTGGGDACASGILEGEYLASNYTTGNASVIPITGLTGKTIYSVCLKARDDSGNISDTTIFYSKLTQDKTSPVFAGVQSLTFDAAADEATVNWVASSSGDVSRYIIKIWKFTPANSGDACSTSDAGSETFTVNNAVATSTTITAAQFELNSLERACVTVNACDGALAAGLNSADNCTAYTGAQAFFLVLPDIDPPVGFTGVKSPTSFTTPTEGEVVVHWNAPSSWDDIRGFKVYDSDGTNVTFLKDCPCTAAACPDEITSCSVTDLAAAKTYRFHVRAYDAAGNIGTLSPSQFSLKKTTDTTPPVPSSNFSAQFDISNQQIELSWNAATDNQDPSENGSIRYILYRKIGSQITDTINPSTDSGVSVEYLGDSTTYTDTDVSASTDYYYIICAIDRSSPYNQGCASSIQRLVQIQDLTNPTISLLTSSKGELDKSWNISWRMADNDTSNDDIRVSIYYTLSSEPATASDNDIVLSLDVAGSTYVIDPAPTEASDPTHQITGLTGPIDQDTYINYLVRVKDTSDNVADATFSVLSQNQVKIDMVTRAEGSLDGSKWIMIKGSGFTDGTTVKIGTNDCTDTKIYIKGHYPLPHKYGLKATGSLLGCKTPAAIIAGPADITVTNPDTSSAVLVEGYEYCNPGVSGSCSNICDRPSEWATDFAIGESGTGNDLTICTAQHFNNLNLRIAPNRFTNNVTFGDNISYEIGGVTAQKILMDSTSFKFELFGQGYVLDGFHYAEPSDPDPARTAIFALSLNQSFIRLRLDNIGIVDFDIQGYNNVSGITQSQRNMFMDNAFFIGKVSGQINVSGVSGSVNQGYDTTIPNIDWNNVYSMIEVSGWRNVAGFINSLVYHGGSVYRNLKFVDTKVNCNEPDGVDYNRCAMIMKYAVPSTWNGRTATKMHIDNLQVLKDSYVIEQSSVRRYIAGVLSYTGNDAIFRVSNIKIDGATLSSPGGYRSGLFFGDMSAAGVGSTYNSLLSYSSHVSGKDDSGFAFGLVKDSSIRNIRLHGTLNQVVNASAIVDTLSRSSIDQAYVDINATITGTSRPFTGMTESPKESTLSKIGIHGTYESQHGVRGFMSTGGEDVEISDSYSQAELRARHSHSGSLYGRLKHDATIDPDISRFYTAGKVHRVDTGTDAAPFVNEATPGSVTDLFWNTGTTTFSGSPFLTNAVGKTDSEMKTQGTFTNFDFTNVWYMPTDSYPRLRWTKRLWAASNLFSYQTDCSASGGTLTHLVTLMNHDPNEDGTIDSVVNLGPNATISDNLCDGQALKAGGDYCTFKLTFSSTPTVNSNASVQINMASGDFFESYVTSGEDIDNVCP